MNFSHHNNATDGLSSNSWLQHGKTRSQTRVEERHTVIKQRSLAYEFTPHFHPYVDKLIKALLQRSVAGLQAMDTEVRLKADQSIELLPNGKPRPKLYEEIFTSANFDPNRALVPKTDSQGNNLDPVRDLDFTSGGAYSLYNWELFYHVPFTIAVNLSKNQRFEDAQRWFHLVFDPTDDSDGPTPERFWKVQPFRYTDVAKIEEILTNLSSNANSRLREDTLNSIMRWKETPFRPHAVARYRHTAYMHKTVMAYLDNLIDWGDSLFAQDSGESINEATQLYVLAANILGPRPQAVPKKSFTRAQTYGHLRKSWDEFSNALVQSETSIPFVLTSPPPTSADNSQFASLASIGQTLYFSVPRNEGLMRYWDLVADRLFKIRNSLNLQGIFRQLPLFEPPINPALLARAAAAGLDVGAIMRGINQPLPLVRFQFLLQKAVELCHEVKSLGGNLLSAMEKQDSEAMAMLRAKHEKVILGLVETVRYSQWQEAIKNREGVESSIENAAKRYVYYERQLGKKESEIQIPEMDTLDRAALEKFKFKSEEPELALRDMEFDIATDVAAQAAQSANGGKFLSSHEVRELSLLDAAQIASDVGNALSTISGFSHFIPEFKIHLQPIGMGGTIEFGGQEVGSAMGGLASAARAVAERLNFESRRASRIDGFARREREWAFQSNLAAGELTQLFKQLRAAQIREAVAEREWTNHKQQIKHADEIEQFLRGDEIRSGDLKHKKIGTYAFYGWMRRETKGLYSQCFQLAFDLAKKAERALQHELGNSELNYVQFGYLAGKEGLLAGEKLFLDLKRMELAYHELNRREYEIIKHVSLLQIDPQALLELRTKGRCHFSVPEELFDLDCPGHYFRRVRNIAVSIPCVTGPYASVSCTLTMLKSSIRKMSLATADDYPRNGSEDPRFSDYSGSVQAIITSTGQNDSSRLFEANLRDERFLPFELAGAVSDWQLQMPAQPSLGEPQQFDYNTISDVVLHIRYTAREGGDVLRLAAMRNLKEKIAKAESVGSLRMFSLRSDFPVAWAKLKTAPADGIKIDVKPEHFPFWSKNRIGSIEVFDLLALGSNQRLNTIEPGSTSAFEVVTRTKAAPPSPSIERTSARKSVSKNQEIAVSNNTEEFVSLNLHFTDLPPSATEMWVLLKWH